MVLLIASGAAAGEGPPARRRLRRFFAVRAEISAPFPPALSVPKRRATGHRSQRLRSRKNIPFKPECRVPGGGAQPVLQLYKDSELLTRGNDVGRPVRAPGLQARDPRCRTGPLTRLPRPNPVPEEFKSSAAAQEF